MTGWTKNAVISCLKSEGIDVEGYPNLDNSLRLCLAAATNELILIIEERENQLRE